MMHESAYEHGRKFFETYWDPRFTDVIELGSQDVNGTLRDHCPPSAKYIGLDMIEAKGVDVVVIPGQPLPLSDASADVAVTSSAFEHDVCFWETFLDLIRVLRPGGLLYVNAPSNNHFHRYPLDCWRFYPDAGAGLVAWAKRKGVEVDLVESFIAKPHGSGWADFVAVFQKRGHSLVRKGRMADSVPSMNVHDFESPELLAVSDITYDMILAEDLRVALAASDRARLISAEQAAAMKERAAALETTKTALALSEHERNVAAERIAALEAHVASLAATHVALASEFERFRNSTGGKIARFVQRFTV